jgi:hypothetical protein
MLEELPVNLAMLTMPGFDFAWCSDADFDRGPILARVPWDNPKKHTLQVLH